MVEHRSHQAKLPLVVDVFNEALGLHQRGALLEAQQRYETVLASQPDHVDANALLGILKVQRGEIADGIVLLLRAIELQPNHAFAQNNLGFAFHERGELDRAITHYRAALAINENFIDALNNLGCALSEQKKLDDAEAIFRQLLTINAEHAPAYYNLGLISTARHEWPQAKEFYRHAIALNRNYAEAFYSLANVLRDEDDFAAALRNYDRALTVKPDFAEAICNKGAALFKMERINEAYPLYERALALKPNYPELLCNMGAWHEKLGHRQQAIDFYDRATQLRPDFVDPLCNMANMLQEEGNFQRALQACDQALSVQPTARNAHMNRGVVLMKMLRSSEAQREFEYCLQKDPDDVDALLNLGSLHALEHDAERALDCANRALALAPRNPLAHWNRGWALLGMGNLQEGWPEYEWGLQTKERVIVQKYSYPRWQGEDISGQTILVYAEQGVGDEILFASCFSDLLKRAKRVIVQCDPRLVALYQRSFPHLQVHGGARDENSAWLSAYEPIDFCIQSGSLPVVLRKTLADFPTARSYLVADPARVAHWRRRLAELPPGLRVGFAWRSRLSLALRAPYYPKIDECLPILKVPGAQFINLQYDNCTEELSNMQRYGVTVHNFSDLDLFNDLDDSVALMSALDLVIAPSTTTFMLAGAVGTAAWQFSPRILDAWRLGQRQYPWLAAATFYDQSTKDDWTPVVAGMARDLRQWTEQRADAQTDTQHGRGEYSAAVWASACDTLLQSLVKRDAVVCCIHSDGFKLLRHGDPSGQYRSFAEMPGYCDAVVLAPNTEPVSALKKIGDNLLRVRPLLLVPVPTPVNGWDSVVGGMLHAHAYEYVTQRSLAEFGIWGVFCPSIAPSSQHPSARFNELLQYYRQMHASGYTRMVGEVPVHTDAHATFPGNELPDHVRDVRQLIEQTQSRTVLDYGAGKGVQYQLPMKIIDGGVVYESIRDYWCGVTIECYEPALHGRESLSTKTYDGVVCTDVLEHIPQQDIPWVIEEIFSHARRFVFASIACYPAMARLPNGENAHVTVKSPEWWKGVFETIAARYPSVRCLLKFDEVATDAKAQSH